MQVDVLFDPFGGRWDDMHAAALAAEQAGFDGVWTYDHLSGAVHDAPDVVEGWTILSAIAATVPRINIGPLVLNVNNRHPGVLAVMAATLQEVSGGRLLLGLGAGGGPDSPYSLEQRALGRPTPSDPVRRQAVEDAIATLHHAWSGTVNGVGGFLKPTPPPPIILGVFGSKMAELAGRVGDGINVPANPAGQRLIDVAIDAFGDRPGEFLVVATGLPQQAARLEHVNRVVGFIGPPYVEGVERLADSARLR